MFRLFSCKTFIHVALSLGVFITINVFAFMSSGLIEVARSMMTSVSFKSFNYILIKVLY